MQKRGQVWSASPLKKSGQVTIFLIIGIVILLLAAGFFFIFSDIKKSSLEVEGEEAQAYLGLRGQVQSYVESCMRETADPSIYLLASQGGIIYPDKNDNILLTDYGMVNYAWLNGLRGLSREKMQEDLAEYLTENIDYCLGDFTTFVNEGIIIIPDYRKISANANILTSSIILELNFPLEVNQPDGDVLKMETFSARIQSSLGRMIDDINNLQLSDIDISGLVNLPYQPTVFPYDESVTIYSLTDLSSSEAPLAFMFAIRNDYPKNQAPRLDHIPDKTFKVGNRWEEVLTASDADNDILTFSSDSEIFPVGEGGTIDVEITLPGAYKVTFTVEDGKGGIDEQKVTITVIEE